MTQRVCQEVKMGLNCKILATKHIVYRYSKIEIIFAVLNQT